MDIENEAYRIIQLSDDTFRVQKLEIEAHSSIFPWMKLRYTRSWVDSAKYIAKSDSGMLFPVPTLFFSQADAQKWVDDKRKYPIVVKSPA